MKNLFLFLLFLLTFSCNKTRGDIVISKKDGKQYTHEQINEMLKQADRYYDQNLYVAAADLYKGVYDIQKPSDYVNINWPILTILKTKSLKLCLILCKLLIQMKKI